MKPFNCTSKRPVAAVALALLVGAGLYGCGGSRDDNDTNGGGAAPTTPAPMLDAFFAAVSGVVSATSETTEASPIDAIVSTAPENIKPQVLD